MNAFFDLRRIICTATLILLLCELPGAEEMVFPAGQAVKIDPIPGERWRGGVTLFGSDQPYVTTPRRDLAKNSYANPCAAFFVSSAGRYVWSDRPFAFAFTNGVMYLDATLAEVRLVRSGSTLREAYLAAVKAHFPPSGRIPEQIFFEKPQYNTWIESNLVPNGQKMVENYIAAIVSNRFPVGVLMIDDGWAPTNAYGDTCFNLDLFPDPKSMFAKARAAGFRTMLWTTPYIFHTAEFYREGCEKGLLLKNSQSGEVYEGTYWPTLPMSGILDLVNRENWDVLEKRYKDFAAEYGFDGFKFDFTDANCLCNKAGRKLPGSCLPGGMVPAEYTRLWGHFASRFAYNELRAGWQYAGLPLVVRLQDKDHSWRDLNKLIPDMLAAGMVGCAYTCPDMIGGGNAGSFRDLGKGTKFDSKLFVRSAQVQALMPMMQFSAAPWRMLAKAELDACRAAADLHVEMAPEILRLAHHASVTGEPIVRPMDYVFPNQGFDACLQQYMLGDRLLVAPVVSADDCVTVRLPKGLWRDDLGALHRGAQTLRLENVPLSRLPRFTRCPATIVEASPGESLESVRDRVRKLPESARSVGVEVRLPPGDIDLEQGIVFTAADSGRPDAPVLWCGADNGRTRILAGQEVPVSAFKPDPERKGVLVADLSFLGDGWPRPLEKESRYSYPMALVTVDGERYLSAGWPDEPSVAAEGDTLGGWVTFTETVNPSSNIVDAVAFVYEGTRPERWQQEKEAYLSGYWVEDWDCRDLLLGRIDTVAKAIYPAFRHVNGMRDHDAVPRRWRIVNALSELDRPGECYVDTRERKLYLIPKRPFGPATRVRISRSPRNTISLRGVSDLEIRNLDIEESWSHAIGGHGITNIVLRGLKIRNVRPVAISWVAASNCALLDSEIYETGNGGIRIYGGDRKRLIHSNNRVENCLFHDCAQMRPTHSSAIETYGCGNVARHNEIYNAPHYAVEMIGNDNLFEYNVVSNVVLETDDAGACYRGGPSELGNVFRYNLFSDIGRDAVARIAAVYFDEGGCGASVFGCVFRRCRASGKGRFGSVLCHGGYSNVVQNCLFIDCARAVGNIPWGQERWLQYLASSYGQKVLKQDVDVESDIYLDHYPLMKDFMKGASFKTRCQGVYDCVVVNCKQGLAAGQNWHSNKWNVVVGQLPPGDVNEACRSLVPHFQPIPFEKIGRIKK